MVPKLQIVSMTKAKAKDPITELVTKIGGQPVWLGEPEWPISKKTGEQMQFLAQVKIEESLFPGSKAKMAYIFMTSNPEDGRDWANTHDFEGGENAVILQPGDNSWVKTKSLVSGPTLKISKCEVEYQLEFVEGTDPLLIDMDELIELDDNVAEEYLDRVAGNKVGGTPGFIQSANFPDEETNWKLLFQLNGDSEQYYINLGDGGCAYAFINPEGTIARMTWDCG